MFNATSVYLGLQLAARSKIGGSAEMDGSLSRIADLRRGIPPSVPAARASVLQDIQKRKCGVEGRHASEH